MARTRLLQPKGKRKSTEGKAEVPSASTAPIAGAKSSVSKPADERAAHIAQSTEHGKEAVTVSI